MSFSRVIAPLLAAVLLPALAPAGQPESLAKLRQIQYPSKADGTFQPATSYVPGEAKGPVPLLVVLHTWSEDTCRSQFVGNRVHEWCIDKGWALIAPTFRGRNDRPEACGSELVVGDIVSAVEHMQKTASIDARRIYLLGTSGGGHASLLLAGRAPDIWAGVSSWVPITDLAAWHAESVARKARYAGMMEKACGGPPGASPKVDEEYRRRSPLTHLAAARGVPVDINAGIKDGHTGSVPISHSLRAFNLLADEKDRLSPEEIDAFVRKAQVPASLRQKDLEDATYGTKPPLFRRQSGAARVTIFDGGHELVPLAALTWLSQQAKSR